MTTTNPIGNLVTGDQCVLCGQTSNSSLRPFYLRTFSHQRHEGGAQVQYQQFKTQCCPKCYRHISTLQVCKVLTYVFMVLPGAVFILAKIGKNDLSGVVIGVASALLAIAIIGNIVIFFRQESLTSKPNCVRTVIDQARQLHKHATGFTPDRVVALTTVSEDSSFLDLHR